MTTPFDHMKGINEKTYNFDSDDRGYNSYIINRGLSFFPDTIFLVNEANRLGLSGKRHYDFLYHTVSKKKRYSKWFKEEKSEYMGVVQEYFSVGVNKAKDLLKVLSEEEVREIAKLLEKGGLKK